VSHTDSSAGAAFFEAGSAFLPKRIADHSAEWRAPAHPVNDILDLAKIDADKLDLMPTGAAALTQVRALRPDAILMDLRMPGMSGMAVTQAIRQTEDLREMIIIAISASVFDTDRQQSLLAGCNAFLPKPIHVEQLLEVLATQLGLTWCYAEGEWPDPAQPASAGMLVPPQEELAALFELAEIGDILGLQARAAQLEQQNPQLHPFTQRLGRLADRFELEQALALIARYLQPEK
jgi:CheY-like chemotaxis protein